MSEKQEPADDAREANDWRFDLENAPRDGTAVDLWAIYHCENPPSSSGERYADSGWHKDFQGEGWRDRGNNVLEWQDADEESGRQGRRVVAWRAITPPSFAALKRSPAESGK